MEEIKADSKPDSLEHISTIDLTEYQYNEFGNKITKDKDGNLHSYNDKPALICREDGESYWYKHGNLHRETGPAISYCNKKIGCYYLDNVEYSKEEWEKKVAKLKQQESPNVDLTQYQTDEFGQKVTLDEDGNIHSYNDKPSLLGNDGASYWHTHGELHRETGPAVIHRNNNVEYYLEGVKLSKEDWEEKLNLDKIPTQEEWEKEVEAKYPLTEEESKLEVSGVQTEFRKIWREFINNSVDFFKSQKYFTIKNGGIRVIEDHFNELMDIVAAENKEEKHSNVFTLQRLGINNQKIFGSSYPKINSYKYINDKGIEFHVLEVSVPGVPKENLNLEMKDHGECKYLKIMGKIAEEHKSSPDGIFQFREIKQSSFSRFVKIPYNIKEETVTTTFKDGIVKLTWELRQAMELPKTSKIEIK